jgi:hypothetical protein
VIHKTVVDLTGEFLLEIINIGVAAWNFCIVIARIYNNDLTEINKTYRSEINNTQQIIYQKLYLNMDLL